MQPDALICYCFRVSRRKLAKFARLRRPRVASQLSECGGAGTGCGWCVPYIERIFEQESGRGDGRELDRLTPELYERMRAEFRQTGERPE